MQAPVGLKPNIDDILNEVDSDDDDNTSNVKSGNALHTPSMESADVNRSTVKTSEISVDDIKADQTNLQNTIKQELELLKSSNPVPIEQTVDGGNVM